MFSVLWGPPHGLPDAADTGCTAAAGTGSGIHGKKQQQQHSHQHYHHDHDQQWGKCGRRGQQRCSMQRKEGRRHVDRKHQHYDGYGNHQRKCCYRSCYAGLFISSLNLSEKGEFPYFYSLFFISFHLFVRFIHRRTIQRELVFLQLKIQKFSQQLMCPCLSHLHLRYYHLHHLQLLNFIIQVKLLQLFKVLYCSSHNFYFLQFPKTEGHQNNNKRKRKRRNHWESFSSWKFFHWCCMPLIK